MKTNTAIFESVISAFAEAGPEDFQHPYLKRVKFILTDDQPNENKQGIEYEDFPRIMASAVNAPIKMYYNRNNVGGHAGSFTIGHISAVAEHITDTGIHQILAEGVLYADEFPNEVDFLEKTFAEGNAPGVSWELRYKDSVLKKGINWLKGAVTTAATFVRHPAYGTRTALLALASNQELDEEHLIDELVALANSVSPSIDDNKGGTAKVNEEELAKLQKELEDLKSQLASANAENESLKATVTSQGEVIDGYKKTAVAEERLRKMTDAGITLDAEKIEAKKEFLTALSEEAFAEYLSDLQAVQKASAAATQRAQASRTPEIPRLDGAVQGNSSTSIVELRERMRAARMGSAPKTE